jgi:hypothetical protein
LLICISAVAYAGLSKSRHLICFLEKQAIRQPAPFSQVLSTEHPALGVNDLHKHNHLPKESP